MHCSLRLTHAALAPSPNQSPNQDGLAEKLGSGEVKTRVRDAPFVQIPLGVTEDRLVGTVDIEASMKVRLGREGGAHWVCRSACAGQRCMCVCVAVSNMLLCQR